MTRILVVDDDPGILREVSRALRDGGYEVTEINSGTDALCLLDSRHLGLAHDLVLLDITMPGLNGVEVLQRLGAGAPPVIVMSGTPAEAVDFAGGKVKRVLTKPFDWDELLAMVREVVDQTGTVGGESEGGA